ncbi:MAG: acyltransferase domain-containing protein [Lewinellaceae bacterium]|nr:acyltransferase domain-containing protein [Lewinellaceae bacterium]
MMTDKFKTVFVFSGQGSQYRGMGRQLFESNAAFREGILQSDAVVRRHLGRSLIEELYHSPQSEFDELLITHPAIIAVEMGMLRLMQKMGIKADFAVGSSLGEFAAAAAAGIWSPEDALEAAIEQAKAIVRSGAEGGMLAVISERASLEQSYSEHGLFLASENFPGHFTLSGPSQNLGTFQAELDGRAVSYIRLPVAHPFHSPLIEAGRGDFARFMSTAPLQAAHASMFISGLDGRERRTVHQDYFWRVISQASNFARLVQFLELQGPCLYIDLGPSGTSATFVKYNLPSSSRSRCIQIMTPFNRETEQLDLLRASLRMPPYV